MKVEKPTFDELGEVRCADCPWDDLGCPTGDCPTAANYEEQCRLAEQAEKGE